MKNHHPVLLLAILALATTAPFSNAQAQQLSESRLAQLLKRFPVADANGAVVAKARIARSRMRRCLFMAV
jgi:hypothetical protein